MVAEGLAASGLTREEQDIAGQLLRKLAAASTPNRVHDSYYDGSYVARHLGISTPASVANQLRMVSGWAGTTVDVLAERIEPMGWAGDDLAELFDAGAVYDEAIQAHLDALIFGVSFISVTAGSDGEPEQLVRGHDTRQTTGIMNWRTRRLDAALTRELDDGEPVGMELWLPDQIVVLTRDKSSPWQISERHEHGLGVVPMVAVVNRSRLSDRRGKSEITAPVRRYTDAAVRSLVAMEVNREFFSVPQRYAIGIDQGDFTDPTGAPLSQWQIMKGRVWTTGHLEEGEVAPSLGEFSAQPPGPYLDQIEGLAGQLSAEAGIPGHYLGLRGDQATSADAIRAMEARLVKRAERRTRSFGGAWAQVSQLVRAARDGVSFFDAEPAAMRWGNPATPTIGATTDAVVKMTQAGIVPPTSQAAWDRLGFTPEEQRIMRTEVAVQRAAQRTASLSQAGEQVSTQARTLSSPGDAVNGDAQWAAALS